MHYFVLKQLISCNTQVPALKPSDNIRDIIEFGCTSHIIGPNKPCTNKVPTEHRISVRLLSGESMQSMHT